MGRVERDVVDDENDAIFKMFKVQWWVLEK
jgi:hypothetical protein